MKKIYHISYYTAQNNKTKNPQQITEFTSRNKSTVFGAIG